MPAASSSLSSPLRIRGDLHPPQRRILQKKLKLSSILFLHSSFFSVLDVNLYPAPRISLHTSQLYTLLLFQLLSAPPYLFSLFPSLSPCVSLSHLSVCLSFLFYLLLYLTVALVSRWSQPSRMSVSPHWQRLTNSLYWVAMAYGTVFPASKRCVLNSTMCKSSISYLSVFLLWSSLYRLAFTFFLPQSY